MVQAAAVACVQVRELVPEEVRAPVGVLYVGRILTSAGGCTDSERGVEAVPGP